MKKLFICFTMAFFAIFLKSILAQDIPKHKVYFIPGQAADGRSFQWINLDEHFETQIIEHQVPDKGDLMPDYARKLAAEIDTTEPFSIVAVSLGGMTAVEMCKFLNPEQLIIVASAKGRAELPKRYHVASKIPLYHIFGGNFLKWTTNRIRLLFEPDGESVNELSTSMLNDLDPKYFKRAVHMILQWQNTVVPEGIVHIHGEVDNTIPSKNIKEPRIMLEDGSHMMIMTRADEISAIVNQTLNQKLGLITESE